MKLTIKGTTKYCTWLKGHLEKEHPKVRKHIKLGK